jgi:hypothetical protein
VCAGMRRARAHAWCGVVWLLLLLTPCEPGLLICAQKGSLVALYQEQPW